MAAMSGSPATERYSADIDDFEVGDAKVQHFGVLMKKPFGHKSARWQRRFFIVKEGFLLYYPEAESKNFDRKHHFNIHPKGCIPLGGCMVEEGVSGAQKFAIKVTNSNFRGEIWVSADNQTKCDEWVKALKEAGTVTWRNAQLGERIIGQLEVKSKQMTEEMNTAIEKLNTEASALEVEKEKKTELEELAKTLEEEKKTIQDAAKNLRLEKDSRDQELQQTLNAMQQIQDEKENLHKKTEKLQVTLQSVSEEKEKTAAELEDRGRLAQQLQEEKKHLEDATSGLMGDLQSLQEQRRLIEEEKEHTEERLKTQELTSRKLLDEKRQISDTAISLQQNLEQVSQEKVTTEAKWKEEKRRRIKTERRLHLAEDSLKRLDKALRDSGVQIDIQIETDVKNLRDFFEVCIKEEQFEAQKLDIMRDAVRAKVSYNVEKQRDLSPGPDSPPPSPDHPLPTLVEQQNGGTTTGEGLDSVVAAAAAAASNASVTADQRNGEADPDQRNGEGLETPAPECSSNAQQSAA